MTRSGDDSGPPWLAVVNSGLDPLFRTVGSAPQTAARVSEDAAQPPRSERQRRADATTEAARRLIDDETAARDAKSQRLKAAQLSRGNG